MVQLGLDKQILTLDTGLLRALIVMNSGWLQDVGSTSSHKPLKVTSDTSGSILSARNLTGEFTQQSYRGHPLLQSDRPGLRLMRCKLILKLVPVNGLSFSSWREPERIGAQGSGSEELLA